MSILSNPQGTPERVWSLIAGLGALGGRLPRGEFSSILNPGYSAGGQQVAAQATNAANGTGAATALELVERNGDEIQLHDVGELKTPAQLADYVHDFLCSRDEGNIEAVIAEAYAWLVVESHSRRDLGWLYELGAAEFADLVDSGLVGEDEDGRLMNPTKVPAWRRWLLFMGLSVKMPDARLVDYPLPARRIEIEMRRAGVEEQTSMAAGAFVDLLANRCPYLDRGRLFRQACARKGYTADTRTLSAVLSNALRDLSSEGKISLKLSRDTADAISLCPDPTTRSVSFDEVEIWPEVKH